jgi:squalene-associated FAD-dependent desaturase
MAPRVAVVGGGLAGLAAAVELKSAGCGVELFERARLPGGRATSYEVDGREVDNGQHVFLGCCTEFIDFATTLGLGGRLWLQDRFDVLVLAPGRRPSRLRAAGLPAPWHLAAGLLGYRELGWADKARVAGTLLAAARRRDDQRPFGEWLRERGQSEASRRAFWVPFFVPALNAPLERVTVAEAAFVVATAFLADADAARFGFLTVPLARLAEAAAARLDVVHLRSPVVRLERAPGGEIGLRTAAGRVVTVDGCVLALPPDRLERLLAGGDGLGLPPLDGFVPRPIVDVHLWHDGGRLGFDFAALVASPVQWVFEKASGYLCCSLSDAGDVVVRPEAELVDLAWAEVSARVPGLAGARLGRGAATRSPEATYAAPPGVARPGPATAAANVVVAGSWTDTGWPDTMESAVRSGRAAARHLARALGALPPGEVEEVA